MLCGFKNMLSGFKITLFQPYIMLFGFKNMLPGFKSCCPALKNMLCGFMIFMRATLETFYILLSRLAG